MCLAVNAKTIRLEWDQDPNGVDGWNIYRSNESGSGYVRQNTELLIERFYLTSVIPGDENFYVATAVRDDLESGFSNEAPYRFVCHGDADGDTLRTVLDAVAISRHITGLIPLSGYALEAADTNGDGAVTVLDVTLVHHNIVGNYPLESCQ